jgi:predicted Zn-dependent protease
VNAASEKLKALQTLFELAATWDWQSEQEDLAWKIIHQFPSERQALTWLERIYTSTSDTSGLQKVYAAMMQYTSPDPVAKNNFAAVSLLLNRQVSEACDIARTNYAQHPDDGVIASTQAYALHVQGHTGEGLKILEKLPETELQKPAIAIYYGLLLASDGQTNKAEAYLARASKSAHLLPEEKSLIAKATGHSISN